MSQVGQVRAMRYLRLACLVLLAAALAGCGFHLRRSAALPSAMQRMHVVVDGNDALARSLVRALETSGVDVVDAGGQGVAELRVPAAAFSTETLSAGGYQRVSEFAVRFLVRFRVTGASGAVLVPEQRIDLSREYSYDATNTVGNASQVEAIRQGLNDDMVQAMLFRLQAAAGAAAAPDGAR